MSFLVDTNIFLEILLDQENKNKAKNFLTENSGQIYISDFSLHSIGVILFKQKKFSVFSEFLRDVLPCSVILSLSREKYTELKKLSKKHNLDFDDSYQTAVAMEYGLHIATMDKDFRAVEKVLNIHLL